MAAPSNPAGAWIILHLHLRNHGPITALCVGFLTVIDALRETEAKGLLPASWSIAYGAER
jgi:hypothetical protein